MKPGPAHLRTDTLLADLDERDRQTCEADLPARRYPSGTVVFGAAREAEALYLVASGRVRLYRLSRSGREVTVAECGPGDVFGALLPPEVRHGTVAQTLRPSTLCVIDAFRLKALAARHPAIVLRLIQNLGRRVASAEDFIEELAFDSAEQRVVRTLRRLADARGPRLRVSHAEIARQAGVVRETVTRVLGELQREGLIAMGYRSIAIREPVALAVRDGG